MRQLHGTYVHRGDAIRRRRRLQSLLLVAGVIVAAWFVVTNRDPQSANAELLHEEPSSFSFLGGETRKLRSDLETTRGELDLLRSQYERTHRILQFSSRFRITGDLATSIFDIALAEGIDPELAFRLVDLESDFNARATSPAGAIGLTQVMLPTARYFQANISRERLYEPKTNLRIGFRYLRALISEYGGDTKLALLVYNRGEVAVKRALAAGRNPTNGYDRLLTKNYLGRGVIE